MSICFDILCYDDVRSFQKQLEFTKYVIKNVVKQVTGGVWVRRGTGKCRDGRSRPPRIVLGICRINSTTA